ncbi:MAG: glycosyltransferase family 4 protein [Sarcina sp.]
MNVLMINLGKDYGGAEKVIETLYINSKEYNFNTYVACRKNTKFQNVLNKLNSQKILSVQLNLKCINKIKNYILQNNIDIIHCHGVLSEVIGVIVSRLTSKKVITTIHSRLDFDIQNKLKFSIYSKFQNFLYRYNEEYIVVSEHLQEYLKAKIGNKFQGQVIYNGIAEIKKESNLNVKRNEITFCIIGRLTEVKGHMKLLYALNELKNLNENVKLLIAGEGELLEELESFAFEKNLNVKFCGFVNDIKQIFEQSDYLIMTSDMEGIPITLLEAMSYKIPIITNLVGGISEISNNNNAFILASNKPNDIANGILKAISAVNSEAKVNIAYEDFRNKYSKEIFLKKHLNVYEEIFQRSDNICVK